MLAKVKKMKKFKIVSPISTKNSDSIELITMSLQNSGHDVYFFLNTKELMHMDKDDTDFIILEPSAHSWGWLDILIKANQALPGIPVVLFSLEITAENGFFRLSQDTPVFLAADAKMLMENLDHMIKYRKYKKENTVC